tara:strand:- start:316 stop:501 length:186 start_codon:yes stop_codon:yes gene_type:complete
MSYIKHKYLVNIIIGSPEPLDMARLLEAAQDTAANFEASLWNEHGITTAIDMAEVSVEDDS